MTSLNNILSIKFYRNFYIFQYASLSTFLMKISLYNILLNIYEDIFSYISIALLYWFNKKALLDKL